MIRELVRIAYRAIHKNRQSSIINILALAIGIGSVLFVANMVIYELSYDKNLEDIYRVEVLDNTGSLDAYTSPDLGPSIVEEIEGFDSFARLIPFTEYRSANLRYLSDSVDRSVYFRRAYYADAEILDFFKIKLLVGQSLDFSASGTMVISKSAAEDLLSSDWQKVLGIEIKQGRGSVQKKFKVVGVFEDREETTHVDFDALISIESQGSGEKTLTGYTYVLGANMGLPDSLYARPVTVIHTSQGVSNEAEPIANLRLLQLLSVVAIIVLLITISNYINSTIIHFVDRCKDVAIRKLHGSSINHLSVRLLGELLSINIIAAIVGVGFFIISTMAMHRYHLMDYPAMIDTAWRHLFLILVAIILINTITASIYPFIFLKRIEIIPALKGAGSLLKTKAFGQAGNVVRALLIFQIVASVVFLSSSLIIHRQLKLLSEQPLDAEIRITGVFPGASGANERFADLASGFLEEMKDFGTIREYSFSNMYRGQIRSEQKITFEDSLVAFLTVVDPGIAKGSSRLISGSGFNYSFGHSPGKIVLDSILAKSYYGYDDTTKIWNIEGGKYQTAGILKRNDNDVPRAFVSGFRYLTYIDLVLNYQSDRGDRLDQFLEKTEYMISTRFPFFFLMRRDQEASGKAEEEVLALFVFFGGISMLVAAIGLFGLSYFITQKKSREVGIRKIHGASSFQILIKLLSDFAGLVLIGGIVAIPVVYFGADFWLQNYARRIELDVSIFLLPVVGIAIVALLTVLDKSWKAARLNPIDVLEEK